MTSKKTSRNYLGWCPRLRQDIVFLTPQIQIPFNSRLIFLVLLAALAGFFFTNALLAISHIYNDIEFFQSLMGARAIFYYLSDASANILALILVIYFFMTSEINNKHRLLLNLLLADLLLQEIVWNIPNLLEFNFSVLLRNELYNQLYYLLDLLDTLFFVTLLVYALNRGRAKKQVFTSTFFALLAAYSFYSFISTTTMYLYVNPMRNPNLLPWSFPRIAGYFKDLCPHLLASYVSLSAYLQLRGRGSYSFTLTPIIKAGFLLYAILSLSIVGWYAFTVPDYLTITFSKGLPFSTLFILEIIRYLGIGAMASASFKITISENKIS